VFVAGRDWLSISTHREAVAPNRVDCFIHSRRERQKCREERACAAVAALGDAVRMAEDDASERGEPCRLTAVLRWLVN
jgi:hypothetical protein